MARQKAEFVSGPFRLLSLSSLSILVACGGKGPEPSMPEVTLLRAEDGVVLDIAEPDTVQHEPVPAAIKTRLIELAVASECARREGVATERALPRLEALFATQGMTLTAYSDAMSRSVDDQELHAAIEKRLGSCAELVKVLWPSAGATEPDVGGADVALPDTTTPDVVRVVEPDTLADTAADTGPGTSNDAGPTVAVADVTPDTTEVKKPAPSWAGTWTGSLKGKQSGTLRVTVSGRTVTGAVATFGRSAIRLKGSLSDKGFLSLGGTVGDEFVRVSGRLKAGAQAIITGTWDGVVARKRSNGTFTLAR